jgi:hypothetical protein
LPPPEDEFAEILVRRNQYARRSPALHQDDFIRDPGRLLGHISNLVAIEAKAFDNLTVDALIGEERHREIVSSG